MSWDPYAVLGVSEHATQAEIERAWRRALHATHPDHNPDASTRRVREVLRAGEVLRDPARRARFDRGRQAARARSERRARRPTWTTLAWDGGQRAETEEVRLPGRITVRHRR